MDALKAIDKVAGKIAFGRGLTFMEAHVLKAMELISQTNAGRVRLSKELSIGEGAARTLVKHLKREGLIATSKMGCTLTRKGRRIYDDFSFKFSEAQEIPQDPIALGPFNVALLVKGGVEGVRRGLEQRDAAIWAGASGATTLIFKEGRLVMPGLQEDRLEASSEMEKRLVSIFQPEEGDVIVVGSASDRWSAELGAKAATLAVLKASASKK